MPKRLWFRAKRYGWGWEPATWQGWVAMFTWTALVVGNFAVIDSRSHSATDTLLIAVPNTLIITAMLVAVCYLTGEKPRWQWGGKDMSSSARKR